MKKAVRSRAPENNNSIKLNLNNLFSGPFSPNYSRRNNKFLPSLYTMTATTHCVPLVRIYRRQEPVRLKQRLIVRPLGPFVFQSRRGPIKNADCPNRIYDYSFLMVLYIIIYQRGPIVLYVIRKSYRQRAGHVQVE